MDTRLVDTINTSTEMLPSSRKRPGDVLLGVAILSGLATIALALLPLIAGTFITGNRIGLRDMAYASFDGIVPNSDETKFLVRMYWFPTTFAWEYPDAPKDVPAAGISRSDVIGGLDEIEEFRNIATSLNLPDNQWRCSHSIKFEDDDCSNIFFDAWHYRLGSFGGSPWIRIVATAFGLLLIVYQLFQEWAIKKKPYWMRCRCLCAKGLCPSPKGTRQEIENSDEHVWDKVRLYFWGLLVLYFTLPAIYTTAISRLFLDHINLYNNRLPERIDMNAQLGSASEAITWGAVGTSFVSFVCILAKWYMTRRPKDLTRYQAVGSMAQPISEQPIHFGPMGRKHAD